MSQSTPKESVRLEGETARAEGRRAVPSRYQTFSNGANSAFRRTVSGSKRGAFQAFRWQAPATRSSWRPPPFPTQQQRTSVPASSSRNRTSTQRREQDRYQYTWEFAAVQSERFVGIVLGGRFHFEAGKAFLTSLN